MCIKTLKKQSNFSVHVWYTKADLHEDPAYQSTAVWLKDVGTWLDDILLLIKLEPTTAFIV